MKYVKKLGLAAVVALGLTAFIGAGTASATVLYSGATKLGSGTEIFGSLTGFSFKMSTTEGTALDECSSGGLHGKTSNSGSATETVRGSISVSSLTWSNCVFTTDTLKGGEFEIHWTSGINGIVTVSGLEVTINTGLFGTCVFTSGTSKVTFGTLTGSTSGDAVLDVNTIMTRVSGLCPSTAKWVGTYTITSPTPLHVTGS
jgi:hypothetical protein